MYKEMKLMDLAKLVYEMRSGETIDFANGTADEANWYGGWCGVKMIEDFGQDNLQYLIGHYGGQAYVKHYAISEYDERIGDFCESHTRDVDCIARMLADFIIFYDDVVSETITVDLLSGTELVETCPHCDHENHILNWDVEKRGYIAECDECGKKMFLCDACLHADDNPQQTCDWHTETMRGVTFSSCKRGRYKE